MFIIDLFQNARDDFIDENEVQRFSSITRIRHEFHHSRELEHVEHDIEIVDVFDDDVKRAMNSYRQIEFDVCFL
jgi:hypothetical protein